MKLKFNEKQTRLAVSKSKHLLTNSLHSHAINDLSLLSVSEQLHIPDVWGLIISREIEKILKNE